MALDFLLGCFGWQPSKVLLTRTGTTMIVLWCLKLTTSMMSGFGPAMASVRRLGSSEEDTWLRTYHVVSWNSTPSGRRLETGETNALDV
jgi:hypothetical protein